VHGSATGSHVSQRGATQRGLACFLRRRQAQAEARSKGVQLSQALEEVRRYKQLLQELQSKVIHRQHAASSRSSIGSSLACPARCNAAWLAITWGQLGPAVQRGR
jgi:hypothetical protein